MNKRELEKWLRDHGADGYVVVVCDKKKHKVVLKGDKEHVVEMVHDALVSQGIVSHETKDQGVTSYVG